MGNQMDEVLKHLNDPTSLNGPIKLRKTVMSKISADEAMHAAVSFQSSLPPCLQQQQAGAKLRQAIETNDFLDNEAGGQVDEAGSSHFLLWRTNHNGTLHDVASVQVTASKEFLLPRILATLLASGDAVVVGKELFVALG